MALAKAVAAATPDDVVVVPAGNTFWLNGGNVFTGANCTNKNIRVDGKLWAIPDFDNWPTANGDYIHFLRLFYWV